MENDNTQDVTINIENNLNNENSNEINHINDDNNHENDNENMNDNLQPPDQERPNILRAASGSSTMGIESQDSLEEHNALRVAQETQETPNQGIFFAIAILFFVSFH